MVDLPAREHAPPAAPAARATEESALDEHDEVPPGGLRRDPAPHDQVAASHLAARRRDEQRFLRRPVQRVELGGDPQGHYIQRRVDAGTPPATINRETQLLGQAYTLAMRSKPPSVTTKPNIRRQSEKGNVRKEFFEPVEFELAVNALPEYLQDVARFAYLTGWRRGDMLWLRWSAVDMRRGVIRLFQGETKNDEGRTLAIAGPRAKATSTPSAPSRPFPAPPFPGHHAPSPHAVPPLEPQAPPPAPHAAPPLEP